MKLIKAEITENFDVLRLVSENNIWEIGIREMMFGYRVCGNTIGDDCYEFDYCAGNDPAFIFQLFAVMCNIFSSLDENISLTKVRKLLPTYEVRPINNDPCWDKLLLLEKQLNNK